MQLTGRDNYQRHGAALGVDLCTDPELANAPEIAAALLAHFLHGCAKAMRAALAKRDYRGARKLVNGGSHGLDRFKSVFDLAAKREGLMAGVAEKRGQMNIFLSEFHGDRENEQRVSATI